MPVARLGFGTPDTVSDPPAVHIPVYDPTDVSGPMWKTTMADGTVVAARLVDPTNAPDHAVKVAGPDGSVYALDGGGPRVLADFESGNWPGDWAGGTGDFTLVTDAPIDGDYSLECTGDSTAGDGTAASTTIETPRGWLYSAAVRADDPDAEPRLLACVQNPNSPHENAYIAELRVGTDVLRLLRRDGWNETELASVSATDSLAAGTVYRLVLDMAPSSVRALVSPVGGQTLAETPAVTDSTLSGGHIGVGDGVDGAVSTFDTLRRDPRDTS